MKLYRAEAWERVNADEGGGLCLHRELGNYNEYSQEQYTVYEEENESL